VSWQYPNATITIEAIGSLGEVYRGKGKQQPDPFPPDDPTRYARTVANVTDLPPDIYLVRVYTVGYLQTRDYWVSVGLGGASDMKIDLVKATRLNVTLTFRKENLIAPIDTYARYNLTMVPVRIEAYNSIGLLAGANTTYIRADQSSSSVEVVGFHDYAGNPCLRWANYYDATDGELQDDYGLPPGTYLVLVWVPGYVQAQMTTLSTTSESTAGTNVYLDRLARVYGNVRGLNMYDDLIPVSWATATAYGPTLTATSSLDGFYEMWIASGTYALGVSSPGYEAQEVEIYVSNGWEMPVDFELSP
jgi:hypothetical protein